MKTTPRGKPLKKASLYPFLILALAHNDSPNRSRAVHRSGSSTGHAQERRRPQSQYRAYSPLYRIGVSALNLVNVLALGLSTSRASSHTRRSRAPTLHVGTPAPSASSPARSHAELPFQVDEAIPLASLQTAPLHGSTSLPSLPETLFETSRVPPPSMPTNDISHEPPTYELTAIHS